MIENLKRQLEEVGIVRTQCPSSISSPLGFYAVVLVGFCAANRLALHSSRPYEP